MDTYIEEILFAFQLSCKLGKNQGIQVAAMDNDVYNACLIKWLLLL